MAALVRAGCPEGSCFSVGEINVPFSYSDCLSSQSDACVAWRWLHCAFPDDQTAGGAVMHAYFFVGGQYEGMGFDFAGRNVASLLAAAGAATSANACERQYPQAFGVVQATFSAAEAKGLALFGWDGCSCTSVAQARFRAAELCYEQLTWSNAVSDVMSYLQCREGDRAHNSFVYFRRGQAWAFQGTGFAFAPAAMADSQLQDLARQASVPSGCVSELHVNVYGEPLSECRAARADSSGSWMWDGKCTEEGGGVHQICMDQLPADFSVTTGQGPWSEGRASMRHCVCIGAWSLYMTREEDPAWTTSSAWPFCDAVPLSALTRRYIGKWQDWNGIPAQIVLGATKLVSKCLSHRSGPGSAAPTLAGACHLVAAFRRLQQAESSLAGVSAEALESTAGINCSRAALIATQATNGSRNEVNPESPTPASLAGRPRGSSLWLGLLTCGTLWGISS